MISLRMPIISPKRDIQACFNEARRVGSGANGQRWVVIIAPDGSLVKVPVPPSKEADQSLLHDVRFALSPEGEPVSGLNITAINYTAGIQARARSFHQILELIPNLSYLIGAACLGNSVVAYEGHPGDILAGVTNADVLILDGGMIPFLQPDWAAIALKTLRQPRIITFGRDGQLARLTQLVEVERPGSSGPDTITVDTVG